MQTAKFWLALIGLFVCMAIAPYLTIGAITLVVLISKYWPKAVLYYMVRKGL